MKIAQPGTAALPVLFIGDSFTQGTEVSSDGLYFEVFEKNSGERYAVSAAGVGGFSTAQEYMLLQKVFPSTKPRVVFWQLTGNDLPENVFAGTDISTVQKPRPYYDPVSGSFAMHTPALWLLQHSELAKYTYGELMKIERSHPFGLNRLIRLFSRERSAQENVQITRRGLEVMGSLLARAQAEYPGTVFVGFSVEREPDADYRAVFESRHALYIPDFPGKMQTTDPGRKLDCAPIDSHWNHEGNQVAARLLRDFADHHLQNRAGTARP
jgi:hypothetical protein